MKVIHVTEKDFNEEIKSGIVLADFFATWCGPCKMIAPVIDELAEECDDVKFIKIDVDKSNDLAQQFAVVSIPTIIIFKDGKPVERTVGFTSKDGLISMINKVKEN